MAGHSHWAGIKHRKGRADKQRSKIFSKLSKEITVAAKLGSKDPDMNPRLRSAIQAARTVNMPKDNIDRAIKKGAGELDGVIFEEIIYEGYGPHNVAIIVEVMTDNRNRSIASVRHAFSICNGNLGSANSVQYMFDRQGSILVDNTVIDEDRLTELILEAGAEDLNTENPDAFQIITAPADFDTVRSYLEENGVVMLSAEVIWNPQNRIEIDNYKKAEQVIKLIDLLEDDDDVKSVHSNFDISESVMAELG